MENFHHWQLRYVLQLVGSAGVTCFVVTDPVHFGEANLLGNQQVMIQHRSRDDDSSKAEGQTWMKDWKQEPTVIFHGQADQPLEQRALKRLDIFSPIAFVTTFGLCPAVASATSPIIHTKEAKGMGSLKVYASQDLAFQSVKEVFWAIVVSNSVPSFSSWPTVELLS